MCGVAALASATARYVFHCLANPTPTLLCVHFPLCSSFIVLTFINTRYSFSHLSIRTASLSPTSIFSRPAAECIRVAMATQSLAPRFPGEASHSWTLYCVSSNTGGLGLSVQGCAGASVAARRNAGQDVCRKFQSRCEKHIQRWL